MKTTLLALIAATVLPGERASAAQFCVNSGSGLQAALTTAGDNGQDDEIRLREGIYTDSGTFSAFYHGTQQNFDLTLSGGWNANCTTFSYQALSILDGGDKLRVMELASLGSGTAVVLSVSRLHFRAGLADGAGGGLKVTSLAANTVTIQIRHSSFIGNTASTSGGGLSAAGETVRLGNNLFIANEAGIAFGAAALTSNDGVAYVVNNSIIGNLAPTGGGLRFGGSSLLELANNVLWANSGFDLYLNTGTDHNRYHNNIGKIHAPVPGVLTGEISTAPEFESGVLNFDPRPRGAMFNGGTNTPPGGLSTIDQNGRPRVSAGMVDIGAYETQVLFYNGFQH